MARLSELRRKKFTHYFRLWDIDHNGQMTFEDYALLTQRTAALDGVAEDSAIYKQMMAYTRDNWNELIFVADLNHDGQISLQEWVDYCNTLTRFVSAGQYPRIPELENYTRSFFSLVDQDGDGRILAEHWHRFCDVWGLEGDPVKMFRRIDMPKKGFITYDDLMRLFYEFILSDDDGAPGNFMFGDFR